jgi:hypothetical protein
MSRSIKILLGCLILLVIGIAGATAANVDPVAIAHSVKYSAPIIAGSAVIVSANITDQMIQDTKVKFGRIQLLTVVVTPEDKDADENVIAPAEQYQFIVKRPDRGLIKMLLPLAADTSQLDDFADKAVKNLIIGGDLDALEDGLVYMGVVTQLKDLIQPAAAFLSNA